MNDFWRTGLIALLVVAAILSALLLLFRVQPPVATTALSPTIVATPATSTPMVKPKPVLTVKPRPTWTRVPRRCLVDSTGSFDDVWVFDVRGKQIVSLNAGSIVVLNNHDGEDGLFTYSGRQYMTPLKNIKQC